MLQQVCRAGQDRSPFDGRCVRPVSNAARPASTAAAASARDAAAMGGKGSSVARAPQQPWVPSSGSDGITAGVTAWG
jgi:hypothetical protein